nr:hypothetical protein [Rhodococcus sp. 15-649-1-2]
MHSNEKSSDVVDMLIHRVRKADRMRSEVYNVPVPALCGIVDFWGEDSNLAATPSYGAEEVRCPICTAIHEAEQGCAVAEQVAA